MTDEDVETEYKLYTDYRDVIDKAKIISIADAASKDYTLSVIPISKKRRRKPPTPLPCEKAISRRLRQ